MRLANRTGAGTATAGGGWANRDEGDAARPARSRGLSGAVGTCALKVAGTGSWTQHRARC